ncbi:MAG: T9SS type A sorting domain-containing protein [Lentimicrobium sp.]|nr:T9SS type A sorting domain-containing protein [Lentimicrobium sp.]
MKHLFTTLIFVCFISLLSLAQGQKTKAPETATPTLANMSSYDSLKLSQLPEYILPEETNRRTLPFMVDNSAKPWFRPLISQVGLECGQASSIGVVFTYELNYMRNVSGSLPENQYATHFAYNFINGGSDAGVCFYETFEILKKAGNPNVADYGGMSAGGPSRWMSGYDLYYNAMHNRVSDVYSIKVNTPEGLQTLKNWIYDHGNGSSAGGLGCFYAEFTHPPSVFPEGTPEAGKHVIYSWGNSANHAMSIVGYNDSIRWDYNNDGQYTNNIDINADGIVDMRDWEIGGFKMANTYGSISGWGDNGFAYMMYKSVADQFQQGGIWNNTVVIIKTRENHEPQLTAKVNLSHSCRNSIRIMAGVSSNPSATEPDHILHFPIFDYQGGCLPMQGNSGEENIEIGLDLNQLLPFVTPGSPARYFLIIQENDPLGSNDGTINSYSIIDYTNGINIINSGASDLPLNNNELTMIGVNAAIDYNPVLIDTETLAPVQLYSYYQYPLQASGGTSPYRWHLAEDYTRFDSTSAMPVVNEQQLTLTNNNNGFAEVTLPFEFPFFGKNYSKVYATSDGYLMFKNSLLPWPYYIEGRTYFIQNAMIAPVMSHPLVINPGQGEGIWMEQTNEYVTFRWKLSSSGSAGSTFNATARIWPNGKIEINYGECILPSFVNRFCGISAGDGLSFYLLDYEPDFLPESDELIRFTPVSSHTGLTLSTEGLLYGTTQQIFHNQPVKVCATDQNNISATKTLYLNTEGLQMEYAIIAGDDDIIEFGEHCTMNLSITNLNSFAIGNTTFTLATNNPEFLLNSAVQSISSLQPGETLNIENAFTFDVSNHVFNGQKAAFTLNATSDEGNWAREFYLTAYKAVIEIASLRIIDGNNGILDPGETVELAIDLKNIGGAVLTSAQAIINSWDSFLTINNNTGSKDTLRQEEHWLLSFEISLSPDAPLYHLIELNLGITGNNQFDYLKTIPIFTGFLVETFETGDFSAYEWENGGTAPWYIDENSAYEGSVCARSGLIYDNETSSLSLNWDVAIADTLSFWFKVSSEPGYDFLHFNINEDEMGRWAGTWNWTQAKIPVNEGPQLFSWKYIKDYSVTNGEDCARIDYIILPVYAVPTEAKNINQPISAFQVYPNPTRNEFTISYTLSQPTQIRIFICDAFGRVIYNHEENNHLSQGNYQLNPENLIAAPGIYSVVLMTDQGKMVKKIIKTSR